MTKSTKPIYVIGHRNPDTDSICSAIAYANLKNKITGDHYVARRAGQINEETPGCRRQATGLIIFTGRRILWRIWKTWAMQSPALKASIIS